MSGLIRSASLTHYADVARGVGLDPGRMLREFGLPPHCLEDPELKIPLDAVRELLEVSAERSDTEAFGLLVAEARRLSNLGPLGLLIREQPTLRLAIDAFVHYGRQLNEALWLTVEETSNVVILREELVAGRASSVRQSTELAIGVAFRMLRNFLGPGWRPKRVCFAHEAPARRAVHERVFGPDVEFGHDFNGIVCARGDLEVLNPNADPEMARLARRMLEAEPTEAPDAAAEVRDLVVMLLGTGDCTIDRAAQHLGVDRRTIHRRLQSNGKTFSDIVDAVRREFAQRYLKDRNRSLAEVASLLGFSAPSGFSRWYRHQFGATPSQQRGRSGVRGG
ncbi:MAG: AraC family transcriptional regulator [Burkholderiaceae bacterium]